MNLGRNVSKRVSSEKVLYLPHAISHRASVLGYLAKLETRKLFSFHLNKSTTVCISLPTSRLHRTHSFKLSPVHRWTALHSQNDRFYTMSQKTRHYKLLPLTSPNVNRFSKFFQWRLSDKFATNWYLNIPTHHNCVATLPCEISMFQKWPCFRRNWSKLPCKT